MASEPRAILQNAGAPATERLTAVHPTACTFEDPVPGSYPLRCEFSYWYGGIKPHLELGRQLKALAGSACCVAWLVFVLRVTPMPAERFRQLGIGAGDRVADIGEAINADLTRLDGAGTIAEVPVMRVRYDNLNRFVQAHNTEVRTVWKAPPETRVRILDAGLAPVPDTARASAR